MNSDLKELYRLGGYAGPLDETETEPQRQPVPLRLSASPGPAAAPARAPIDPAEVPPLSPEQAEALQEHLELQPGQVVARARQLIDTEITESDLRAALARARYALASPDTSAGMLAAERKHTLAAVRLPKEFTFPDMDLGEVPIDAGNRKFETKADWFGWLVNCGPYLLAEAPREKFRWHDDPAFGATQFTYEIDEPTADHPLDVALFSDFGTGLYQSRYIAKRLKLEKYPYAVHLGDVYYAGRRSEFREHFEAPLDPILASTALYTLNSNHEMFSAGIPYFEYIDRRRAAQPETQRQQGSYFCLQNSRFQLLGIDTAYFGQGRLKEPRLVEWLRASLLEGRAAQRLNILLSADHPYEYGKEGATDLLRDLASLVLQERLVDLWFWGNTHYCGVFNSARDLPFSGSCIGHGGYPCSRKRLGDTEPAPLLFLETRPRFPEWTGVRQGRGNNGYAVLSLRADGHIGIRYVDWMKNERCRLRLVRDSLTNTLAIAELQLGK